MKVRNTTMGYEDLKRLSPYQTPTANQLGMMNEIANQFANGNYGNLSYVQGLSESDWWNDALSKANSNSGNEAFKSYDKANGTNYSDQNNNNSGSWWNGGTLGAIAGTVMNNLDGIAGISNSILGWKQFSENRKLIAKQMENIDEQIAASKEYRQQRADEIARLNRVRKNTQKSFNTGTTITRSY
jgi:hypothetical protein